MNVSALISEVDSSELEQSRIAIDTLTEGNLEVVQPILDELESHDPYGPRSRLHDVLLQIHNPEIIPLLLNHLSTKNVDLHTTICKIIEKYCDARAFLPLIKNLTSSDLTFDRCSVVHALGVFHNEKAIAPLLKTAQGILEDIEDPELSLSVLLQEAEEEYDLDPFRELVEISKSLAKLGNHILAPIIIGLVKLNPEENLVELSDEFPIIRAQACESLCHTVGAGMLTALQQAISNGDDETRNSALEAIFYLGLFESIEILIGKVDDPSTQIAHNATVWFNRLTGTNFEAFVDSPNEIRDWWKIHKVNYRSGICYRFGEEILVERLIEKLSIPNSTPDFIKDIYIFTGKNIGHELANINNNEEALSKGQAWWNSQLARSFIPGKLYKYGRGQDLGMVY